MHQNIKERVDELAEALQARGPTPANTQIYQTLDDDITRAKRGRQPSVLAEKILATSARM